MLRKGFGVSAVFANGKARFLRFLPRCGKWIVKSSCQAISVGVIANTFLTLFGYPARIIGKSMSPALNAEEALDLKDAYRDVITDIFNLNEAMQGSLVVKAKKLEQKYVSDSVSYRADFQNHFNDSCMVTSNIRTNLRKYRQEIGLILDDRDEDEDECTESESSCEWVFVNCWDIRESADKKSQSVKIGDVVVFISPKDPNDHVIKRIVATEHQIIQTLSSSSKKTWRDRANGLSGAGDVVVIPAGHCWVEGDNHKTSVDSRKYGPISTGLIFGKVTWVIFPFHRIRRLDSKTSPQINASGTRIVGNGGVPRYM